DLRATPRRDGTVFLSCPECGTFDVLAASLHDRENPNRMPYRNDEDDDENEADLDEREDPDTDDADWNLDPHVVECPYCAEEVSEDALKCPHCGTYISKEDSRGDRKPIWMIVGMVLVILILLSWIFTRQ